MSTQTFEIGTESPFEERDAKYDSNYPHRRTEADQQAANKEAAYGEAQQNTAAEAGHLAVNGRWEGQGLEGMGEAVHTIPVETIDGPAQEITVRTAELDQAL